MKRKIFVSIILIILSFSFFISDEEPVYAADFESGYSYVTYGVDNGLISAEINSIVQTSDGYIWAGSYSGLYRYNGAKYEKMALDESISSVVELFEDSNKNLWIGTNDSGVARYDTKSGDIKIFSINNGLASDTIRSICEDEEGNIYIGTSTDLCFISPDETIKKLDHLGNINCVYGLEYIGNGRVSGVTKTGELFVIKKDELLFTRSSSKPDIEYTTAEYAGNDVFLVGLTGENIVEVKLTEDGLEEERKFDTDGLLDFNHIFYSKNNSGFFLAASNGFGFLGNDGKVQNLSREDFYIAISDMEEDYQGNLWFTSSKQGICKLSPIPFEDIFKKADVEPSAVNALLLNERDLYVGTDSGVIVIDVDSCTQKENEHTETFKGQRIRHFYKDSRDNIWVSEYGKNGLVRIEPDGKETIFNETTKNTLGPRFRFCMELSDGEIFAASSEGLNFIKDDTVIKTIGIHDGLSTPTILSAVEKPDGSVLAGSDGDGIYVIKDRRIVDHIGVDEGLTTMVVLRIVPFENGYLYVTSNGLFKDSGDMNIQKIVNFPYNNNYDIYLSEEGQAWVCSSAGMYVVNTKDLINDGNYNYVLLNRSYGLDTTFTANSWNVVDGDNLYLCCTDGVRTLNTKTIMNHSMEYDMVLSLVEADGVRITETDGVFNIPAGAKRLMLGPAILNYTASNPLIFLQLEGSGDEGLYIRQADMTDMYYTNIPYGSYNLRMKIVDELSGDVLKEKNFFLNKPALFHETTVFRILIFLLITGAVAFLAWFGAKVSNMAIINRQYEQIKEAKEEAEYANHAKSRFLANMSHEIRTPINAVLGLDEMILRESTEKEIRGYAHDIYTSANTLLSLINDILDSSKIESGKMEIVPVEYELITLVKDLVNMISQRARTKDLKLIVNLDENLPSKLFGDDVRIRQVVTNILTNAVKYTPQGSVTFSVSGRREEEEEILTFLVEDTGIGIKEEDLPKLFEEYQRIEEGRNRNIEGTGLGMNITLQLLALMGSHLEVSSVYGEGSKFWFDLRQKIVDDAPVGNFEESMNSPEERYSYEGGFEAPDAKILVVDDNEMNLKVFKSLLKITKIKVTTATGGRQAIDLASKEKFDIIFTDHMMPDMDGIETLQHLRELDTCKGVPIYVLTANAVTGAREQYMEAGFDGFVSKPIVSDKLEQVIKDALPEELIQPLSEDDERSKASSAGSGVPDDLPSVEGLDWSFAWLHLPDIELLSSSLKEFYDVLALQADKLQGMYDKLPEPDAMDAYRIQVHAMKSSAATVGIVPLAGMAKMLEFAAKDSDIDTIRCMHEVFSSEWRSYRDKLKGVFGLGDDEGKNKPEGDKAGLLTMLDELSPAMEELDVDTADMLMEKMHAYRYNESVDELIMKLSAAVTDLDIELSQELIGEIRANI